MLSDGTTTVRLSQALTTVSWLDMSHLVRHWSRVCGKAAQRQTKYFLLHILVLWGHNEDDYGSKVVYELVYRQVTCMRMKSTCCMSGHPIIKPVMSYLQPIMLRLGQAYGPTWVFWVWRWFFWRLSSHCCLRNWVKLGLSLGIEYRLGTEGYSGQSQGCTDWEALCLCSCREEWDWKVEWLMQLLESLVQKSQLYENSDLKSKWNTGTCYILLSDSKRVK